MIFNNAEIIKDFADLRIGGVKMENKTTTYGEYIGKVRFRVLKLVCDYVKDLMSEGSNKIQAIAETLGIVHNHLHINEQQWVETEEGITEQIMSSDEWKKWESNIFYRFKSIHAYENLPFGEIPVSEQQSSIDDLKELEEENIFTLLDGLIAQYK